MEDFYYCLSRDDHVRIYKNAIYLTKLGINAVRILDTSCCGVDLEAERHWYVLDTNNVLYHLVLDIRTEQLNDAIVQLPSSETIRDISILNHDNRPCVIILDSSNLLYRVQQSGRISRLSRIDDDAELRFLPCEGCALVLAGAGYVHLLRIDARSNSNWDLDHHRCLLTGVRSIVDVRTYATSILVFGTDSGLVKVNFEVGTSTSVEISSVPYPDHDQLNYYSCSLDSQGQIYFDDGRGSKMIESLKIPAYCKPVEILNIGSTLRRRRIIAVVQDDQDQLYLLYHSGLKMALSEDKVQLKTQLPACAPGRRTKSARC